MICFKKILLSLFLFIFLSSFTYHNKFFVENKKANFKSLVTDSTYNCKVVTIQKDIYENVSLFGLSDSSVKIFKGDFIKELLITNIRSITFNRRGFWKGAAIGAGIGFGLGLLGGKGISTGDGSPDWTLGKALLFGFVFAIPLVLIGGGLGVLFASDKFYDLSKLTPDEKQRKVKYLIKEYSDR